MHRGPIYRRWARSIGPYRRLDYFVKNHNELELLLLYRKYEKCYSVLVKEGSLFPQQGKVS